MSLNKTYRKIRIGETLSDTFPIQNDLTQEDALLALPFNFALEYTTSNVKTNSSDFNCVKNMSLLLYTDNVNILNEHIS